MQATLSSQLTATAAVATVAQANLRRDIFQHVTCIATASKPTQLLLHRFERMASISGKSILTTIGSLLILHAAYSCLHYRSLAVAADLPDTSSPPADVVVEVIFGFFSCLVGQLLCGPFHQVRVSGGPLLGSIRKSRAEIVAPAYRTRDFDLFNTRTKEFYIAKRAN